jgi:hypothetical protein
METAGNEDCVVGFDSINQTMFIVDASGPISGQVSFERLGLADSSKWRPQNILDQLIESL